MHEKTITIYNPEDPAHSQLFAWLMINHFNNNSRAPAPRSAKHLKYQCNRIAQKNIARPPIYRFSETMTFQLPGDLFKVKICDSPETYEWWLCGPSLGRGSMGTVYPVKFRLDAQGSIIERNPVHLAIKKLPYSTNKMKRAFEMKSDMQRNANNEKSVSHLILNKNYQIASEDKQKATVYYNVFYESSREFIVIKRYPGKPLNECNLSRLTSKQKVELAYKIIIAVVNFHKTTKRVHSDLKPENIMYDEKTGEVNLIDYGLSHTINTEVNIGAGTDYYAPPEAFLTPYTYQTSFDTFSLVGVITKIFSPNFEIEFRQYSSHPFNLSSVQLKNKEDTQRLHILLNQMQNLNRADRPSDEQLLKQFELLVFPPELKTIEYINKSSEICETHLKKIIEAELKKPGNKSDSNIDYEKISGDIIESKGMFSDNKPTQQLLLAAQSYKKITELKGLIKQDTPREKLESYQKSFRDQKTQTVFRSNPDPMVVRFVKKVSYFIANIATLGLVDLLNNQRFVTTPQERLNNAINQKLNIAERLNIISPSVRVR